LTTTTMTTTSRPISSSAPRALVAACLAAGALLGSPGGLAARQTPASPAPSASPAAAGDLKITLKWTTASEVDNYDYFVHRGDSEDGPFTQMNKKAIPGAGNSDTPSHYVWEDRDVEPGRTYYYWLESISVQGVKEKFSPVLSRTCCGKAAQASPAPEPAPAPTPGAN
jgi:hypothetical protein